MSVPSFHISTLPHSIDIVNVFANIDGMSLAISFTWGGVKVAGTSRKVASEKNRVPTSSLESELYLFWLFFSLYLVIMNVSRYTQL
jgi:hypothetical protein